MGFQMTRARRQILKCVKCDVNKRNKEIAGRQRESIAELRTDKVAIKDSKF
jgi:hypothetical protein